MRCQRQRIVYALPLAALYTDLGHSEQAAHWLEIVATDPDEYLTSRLVWIQLEDMVNQGDIKSALAVLAGMLPVKAVDDTVAVSDGLFASYYLEDYEAGVALFDQANELRPWSTWRDYLLPLHHAEVLILTAHVLNRNGRGAQGDEMLQVATNDLQTLLANGRTEPTIYYLLALTDAYRGNDDAALANIQRAVDEGWREHWRPQVEPLFESINQQEIFVTMMAGLAAQMKIMRNRLNANQSFDTWRS